MRLRRGQGYECPHGWEYTVLETKTTSDDGCVWLHSHRSDIDFAISPDTELKTVYLYTKVTV
jgi:hypothetical protein